MEKKFLSHLPARLVIGHRWYIVYYQVNPSTGIRERFRETYDLNRIPDFKDRAKHAQAKLDEINRLLPSGFPFAIEVARKGHISIVKAVEFAHKIKTQSDRYRTISSYDSVVNIFINWITRQKIEQTSVGDFNKALAIEYMDHLVIERKIGNRTYNNYLIRMKALFNALVSRDYIISNPFGEVSKKERVVKTRRTFTDYEKGVVAHHIATTNPDLFRIVLLIYHCFLRPAEIRRLRLKMFNFKNGTITLPGSITKNKRERTVTIPDIIKPYFYCAEFTNIPHAYLIWGQGFAPHVRLECGKNIIYRQHLKVLKELKQNGTLEDITGLSLYSWKDTGVTDASDYTSLPDLMMQCGHTDPKVTMIYYQKNKAIKPFKQIKNKLV